jgi:hypothetical protein
MVTNSQLNSTVESLKKLVAALTDRVGKLEKELEKHKTPVASPPATIQTASNWASHLFSSKSKVVSAAKIEMSDKRQRNNNIMVFGLAPSKTAYEAEREKEDFARVEIILNKCGMQEIYTQAFGSTCKDQKIKNCLR